MRQMIAFAALLLLLLLWGWQAERAVERHRAAGASSPAAHGAEFVQAGYDRGALLFRPREYVRIVRHDGD